MSTTKGLEHAAWKELPSLTNWAHAGSEATSAPGVGRIRLREEATWDDILELSEQTSFRFLEDEPDIYTEEDGEPL